MGYEEDSVYFPCIVAGNIIRKVRHYRYLEEKEKSEITAQSIILEQGRGGEKLE